MTVGGVVLKRTEIGWSVLPRDRHCTHSFLAVWRWLSQLLDVNRKQPVCGPQGTQRLGSQSTEVVLVHGTRELSLAGGHHLRVLSALRRTLMLAK